VNADKIKDMVVSWEQNAVWRWIIAPLKGWNSSTDIWEQR
jgi:hypothetical protein